MFSPPHASELVPRHRRDQPPTSSPSCSLYYVTMFDNLKGSEGFILNRPSFHRAQLSHVQGDCA